MRPLHLDLFTGIAGATLAAEACGWETAGFSEILPFQSSVLKKHWPDVPNLGDIRAITEDIIRDIGPLDLVTGGAPCQVSSLAGKRRGMSDERWLWDEFVRVVGLAKPRWLCGENPIGIHSLDGGKALRTVLGDFAALGYSIAWVRFPASAVGAPHQRQRIFIVGFREDMAHAESERQPAGGVRGREETLGSISHDESSDSGELGTRETVADHNSFRRDRGSGEQWQGGRGQSSHSSSSGRKEEEGISTHSLEPGLGDELLRIPGRVVEYQERARRLILNHKWPAGRGEQQYSHEFPRTSRTSVDRKDKLISLGNCVVPQQQYMILSAIWNMDPLKAGL